MTITGMIDELGSWLESDVCSKIKLKKPDDNHVDASYQYKLVEPLVSMLFYPTKDKMPPGMDSPHPGICLQMLVGDDVPHRSSRHMNVRLSFCAWNPGVHERDNLIPNGQGGLRYPRQGEIVDEFRKTTDGWRDVWNFVDVALREIESADNMNGLILADGEPVKFGLYTMQDDVVDFYPYWYAWVEISVQSAIIRNKKSQENFL